MARASCIYPIEKAVPTVVKQMATFIPVAAFTVKYELGHYCRRHGYTRENYGHNELRVTRFRDAGRWGKEDAETHFKMPILKDSDDETY